jgi:hypothetical protein
MHLCAHLRCVSFLVWLLLPTYCRCRGLLLSLITLIDIHAHTLGRTTLYEGSARRRYPCLSTLIVEFYSLYLDRSGKDSDKSCREKRMTHLMFKTLVDFDNSARESECSTIVTFCEGYISNFVCTFSISSGLTTICRDYRSLLLWTDNAASNLSL